MIIFYLITWWLSPLYGKKITIKPLYSCWIPSKHSIFSWWNIPFNPFLSLKPMQPPFVRWKSTFRRRFSPSHAPGRLYLRDSATASGDLGTTVEPVGKDGKAMENDWTKWLKLVVWNIFYFSMLRIIILTTFFQRGWNHQSVEVWTSKMWIWMDFTSQNQDDETLELKNPRNGGYGKMEVEEAKLCESCIYTIKQWELIQWSTGIMVVAIENGGFVPTWSIFTGKNDPPVSSKVAGRKLPDKKWRLSWDHRSIWTLVQPWEIQQFNAIIYQYFPGDQLALKRHFP